jgi:hypothetical protein
MKSNASRALIIIFLFAIFFCYGVLVGKYQIFPYNQFSSIKSKYAEFKWNNNNATNLCVITQDQTLDSESILIVGHSSGALGNPNQLIPKKLQNFIEQNSLNIHSIIFAGDIFSNPSKRMWANLIDYFQAKEINLIIAPGNHDVGFGENARRDIFFQMFPSNFLGGNPLILNNIKIYIEDSTVNNWHISPELIKQINSNADQMNKIFLIRHHIPISDFIFAANSLEGYTGALPRLVDLEERFKLPITIISGDTGGNPFANRSLCKSHRGLTTISNGMNQSNKNTILALSKNNIFEVSL